MAIPLVDLQSQYREIRDEIEPAVSGVMSRANFILGPEVEKFEEAFAAFCGAKSALGVASGTDALRLSLEGMGVGRGDEVIVPANTFIATAFAVSEAGATPVFADVDERTYNIDVDSVKDRITDKTRAIIPVHLYGQPADIDPILGLARERNLLVVEDACQAHGAEYRGKRVGSLGDAGCFSFYPGKNLGAYGDGGMVVTDRRELAEALVMLRNVGRSDKHRHPVKGLNSRLDNIQAAVLLVKLGHLPQWNESRRSWAHLYNELLDGTPCVRPYEAPYARHVYHLYVVRVKRREELQEHLTKRGVSTGIHYPIPIHLQEAYKELGHRRGDFPISERLAEEILSLPIYPELGEEGVAEVVDAIRDFYG